MTEQPTSLDLKDFLELPNGREEYAKNMLNFDKQEFGPDTNYTDEENLELYRIQFDIAILHRQLNRKEIKPKEFVIREEELNNQVSAISTAAYERKYPNT